jgi:hypothetical protein
MYIRIPKHPQIGMSETAVDLIRWTRGVRACRNAAEGWRIGGSRGIKGRAEPTGTSARLAVSRAWAGGRYCGKQRAGKSSRRWPARKYAAVGRTRPQGMISKAVADEDQRSMSSLMRRGGRSGPRARRASIRRVPDSRSCSIGLSTWPAPNQFAVLPRTLPAVKCGHTRLQRDIHDPPE